MKCEELRADIEELKQAGDRFEESIAKMLLSETRKTGDLLANLENEILEKYLEVFAEKNPLAFDYEFGGIVEGIEAGAYDSVIPFADGRVVVVGDDNISIYEKSSDGKYDAIERRDILEEYCMVEGLPCGDVLLWEDSKKMPRFLIKEKNNHLESIHGLEDPESLTIENVKILPNGDVLVCTYPDDKPNMFTITKVVRIDDGNSEVRYEAVGHGDVCVSDDPSGTLLAWFTTMPNSDVFFESIETGRFTMRADGDSGDFVFEATDSFSGFVGGIIKAFELPNGDFAVVSSNAEVGIFRKNGDGNYEAVSPIKVEGDSASKGETFRVGDSYQLSDGNIALVCNDGKVFVFDIETGEFSDEVKISGGNSFSDGRRVFSVSDGGLLLLDSDDKFRNLTMSPNGGYEFSDDTKGFDEDIYDIVSLPDGGFWIEGSKHCGVFEKNISVDALKKNLSRIAGAQAK